MVCLGSSVWRLICQRSRCINGCRCLAVYSLAAQHDLAPGHARVHVPLAINGSRGKDAFKAQLCKLGDAT